MLQRELARPVLAHGERRHRSIAVGKRLARAAPEHDARRLVEGERARHDRRRELSEAVADDGHGRDAVIGEHAREPHLQREEAWLPDVRFPHARGRLVAVQLAAEGALALGEPTQARKLGPDVFDDATKPVARREKGATHGEPLRALAAENETDLLHSMVRWGGA